MSARSLPEWVGKSADEEPPPHVRVRVFDAHGGICAACKLKIKTGEDWQLDHAAALINGGLNQESNLQPLHIECHVEKTGEDVAEKSKTYRMRAKHLGLSLRRKRQWR